MPTALVTGGSAASAAPSPRLSSPAAGTSSSTAATPQPRCAARQTGARGIPGDVTDPTHREQLARAVADTAGSTCWSTTPAPGPDAAPPVAALPSDALDDIWLTNVAAPLALTQPLLPLLSDSRGASGQHPPPMRPSSTTRAGAGMPRPRPRWTTSPSRSRPRTRGSPPTPSTPATCGRRCTSRLPRRGHQRPPAAGDGRAPAVGTGGPAAAQRPVPGRGHHPGRQCSSGRPGGGLVSALPALPLTRFASPGDTTAPQPPEERGLPRDGVRLLVARDSGLAHARFRDLPAYLAPGDLVVVNSSATLAAELDAVTSARAVVVHAATRLDDGTWVVELRTAPDAARPVLDAAPGEVVELRGSGRLELIEPYPRPDSSPTGRGNRLWRAAATGPRCLSQHLLRHGRPIAYGYLERRYPLSAYQTVFASRPGSAEMPSAGRPFTAELVTALIASGVGVTAVTLHTGVSSQDAGEAPQPERFEVPAVAARLVNATSRSGRSGRRGRHHRDPRARVGGRGRRAGPRRGGVDRSGGLTSEPSPRGRWPHHGLAQPRGVPPAPRGVGRGAGADPAGL